MSRGPVQVHASFGRALNFPGLEVAAFSTVAIPALGQSWRTLRPERLAQTEAGVRYEFAPGVVADLTLFRNEGRDRFVLELVEAVRRDRHTGLGKPEPLKHLGPGVWSRRITQEHRLVPAVKDDRICFLQARYHY